MLTQMEKNKERIYYNEGNQALISLMSSEVKTLLDVGCGAGGNAKLLKLQGRSTKIFGITKSDGEAKIATSYMENCWIADLENDPLLFLQGMKFDCLLFSHVLEHLVDPVIVLKKLLTYLKVDGEILIAVPNFLYWSNRIRLLAGIFKYSDTGFLDRSHLRFFTWETVLQELIEPIKELKLAERVGDGSFPLWFLRRYFFPKNLSYKLDNLAVRYLPGLFSSQILLVTRKK